MIAGPGEYWRAGWRQVVPGERIGARPANAEIRDYPQTSRIFVLLNTAG
jgi:hypothetical protein